MVSRNNSQGNRDRIGILTILCIISFLIVGWFAIAGGPGIIVTLVSLITVVLAGIWFGRNGIAATVLLAGGILFITWAVSGRFPLSAMVFASVVLVTGFASAILSERIKIQRDKETPLIAGEPGITVRDNPTIGDTLGLAQYCILPYLNVRRLKEKKDVRGLIRALTSDDINLQYNATEALGELGDPAAVTALIHVLTGDRYSALRWKAAEALGRIGEPAVGPLIRVLGNENDDVRWKAAIALGDIGDLRAVEPLALLLGDTDPYVRGRAGYALSTIGQPAVPALVRVLEQGTTEARPAAVAALGRINDPHAIAPLVRALGDADERVRAEALVSLERAETNVLDRFLVILNQAGTVESGTVPDHRTDGPGTRSGPLPGNISLSENDLREYLVSALQNTGDPAFRPLIRDILAGFDKK